MQGKADLTETHEHLAALFAESRRIVPFTGAGLSTESGIPDFRSPGGFWTRNQPIPFDAFMASQSARDEAWRRRLAIDPALRAAEPGRGHLALASLWRAGKVPAVVTQNIDNLHQKSGIAAADIVELHGNTTYATCLDCGTRYEIDWMRARLDETGGHVPDCPGCGGFIKTATISFGQSMPDAAMRRAQALATSCDLLLVLGSSLVVYPAAALVPLARRAGARIVIVNREPTDFDDLAERVVREDIGAALAPFV
jgi:NAD-dependent deacetylase